MKYCAFLVAGIFLFYTYERIAVAVRITRPPQPRNVPKADQLRRMIDHHIYKRTSPQQSRIMRFLFHGDTGTQSPLEAFNVLDRDAISQIARHARTLDGHSQELEFEYWERKVDFYTQFNYTGDHGEFDPMHPHVPFLMNKTLEKYKQKAEEFIESKQSNNDTRRFNLKINSDEGKSFVKFGHPQYQKIFSDLMLQAIYSVRLDIHKTQEIRSRYRYDVNYRIAALYSMCLLYVDKIKSLYSTAHNLLFKSSFYPKFLHFLVIYEKVLATHFDVESCVRRIDDERKWHYKWVKSRVDEGGKVYGSNSSLNRARQRDRDKGTTKQKKAASGYSGPRPGR